MNAEHDIPAPPDDLRERCLATIPAIDACSTRLPARKRRGRIARISLTALAVAGFGFWLTRPVSHVRNAAASVSGDVAFAETVRAMRRVAYYHSTSKEIGWNPQGGKDGKTWYPNTRLMVPNTYLIRTECWFDSERGYRRRSVLLPNPANVASFDSLDQPNGSSILRTGSWVEITQFPVSHWAWVRDGLLRDLTNTRSHVRGFDDSHTPHPYLKISGMWKGRRVTQFLFDAPPSAINAAHGAPVIRTSVYVDPYSQLIIAQQQFARWPDHPERGEKLVLENEQDYDRPADAAKFDLLNITTGAKSIQRAKGGPGSILSPDRDPND